MATFQFAGYQGLRRKLARLGDPDATPLLERWVETLIEGNRRGVLSGVDGNDQPMPPLKYRQGAGKRTRNRQAGSYGTPVHESTGWGLYASGLHDTLASSQYRQLTGPRLAPRGDASRAIKNLHGEIRHQPGSRVWEAVGAWYGVVSHEGTPFLPFHFEGQGRNPRYDLRPIRPRDYQFCLNAFRAWAHGLLRDSF